MGRTTRRIFSAQFKLEAVMELLAGHKSVAQICHERQITDKLLYDWKRTFIERAPCIFDTSTRATNEAQIRIAELERMVARLATENEILKKAGSSLTCRSSKNEP